MNTSIEDAKHLLSLAMREQYRSYDEQEALCQLIELISHAEDWTADAEQEWKDLADETWETRPCSECRHVPVDVEDVEARKEYCYSCSDALFGP